MGELWCGRCDRVFLSADGFDAHSCLPKEDKTQARLDAALDALAVCRKSRDHYRQQANRWRDTYYDLLRITGHEPPPLEEPDDVGHEET